MKNKKNEKVIPEYKKSEYQGYQDHINHLEDQELDLVRKLNLTKLDIFKTILQSTIVDIEEEMENVTTDKVLTRNELYRKFIYIPYEPQE